MKKALVGIGVLVSVFAVHASTLMWQVTDTTYNSHNIDYATLRWSGGTVEGDISMTPMMSPSTVTVTPPSSGEMSFYVEFFNYDIGSIGLSKEATYASLLENGNIVADPLDVGKLVAWMPKPDMVPEPTSALMMMIGVAFLGLKRRKA